MRRTLFQVGSKSGGQVSAGLGEMDDPEVNLWLDVPWAGSNTVTLGEPYGTRIPVGPPQDCIACTRIAFDNGYGLYSLYVSPNGLVRFQWTVDRLEFRWGGPQFQYGDVLSLLL
jgi:hypothetical protein